VTNKASLSVEDAFERALGEILTRVFASASAAVPRSVAIGYSGGLDSSALLHLAHGIARSRSISLHAFHVHHGISPNADAWLAHCRDQCARMGVAFDARHVDLPQRDERGVEEAARMARYAALGELCRAHGVPVLLTAHHQDDQAETVLLQLLRGSGVAGMSGMESMNTAPGLLGDPDLLMARPLLGVTREALERFMQARGVDYVEDESNLDTRYARNALRQEVMPALGQYFPGFQQRLARSAGHAQSAQQVLNEVAAQDLAACMEGACIDVGRLRLLSAARIDNTLRYWFASRGVRMPATAWLDEMRTQLLQAKADAQVCVMHPDCTIRRYRDRIYLTPRADDVEGALQIPFRWDGEAQMEFAAFGGRLLFEAAEQGVDAAWLRQQSLLIHYRSGGERLKPAPNRPTRSLKHHYQALDIPAWERERLPLVSTKGGLLFASGVGMDCSHFGSAGGSLIRLRWETDNR
jgi:tRNA(Ile)-lysidine synthase